MATNSQTSNETLEPILDFLSQNMGWFVLIAFFYIYRKGVAGFLKRIIKLTLTWGDASGGVEAVAPSQETIEESQLEELGSSISPPTTSEPEPAELKDKEEAEKDWFPKMHGAFLDGEIDQAKELFEMHQQVENDPDRKHSNEALFLYFMFKHGNNESALVELEELYARSNNEKQRNDSVIWLAWSYDAIKDYAKEIELWNGAISDVVDEGEKTSFIINLAHVYWNNGDPKSGIDILEDRLRAIVEHGQRASLYTAISSLEKKQGNLEVAAVALEKAVEYLPGDRGKLFDAAYAQSEESLNLLSICNYQTLLDLNPRHAVALNNLGVCASEFELTGKQISLYRRSIDEGSTLAMANLANQMINNGFWLDAGEILDKARKMDNPHENVGNALYRLQTLKDQEAEKWTDLINKAISFQREFRIYAEAMFDRSAMSFDCEGPWYTERGQEAMVTVDGETIKGLWDGTSIKGLWDGTSSTRGNKIDYQCTILGDRRNRSVKIVYRRKPEHARSPSLLTGSLDQTISYYSYFTEDLQTWVFFSSETEDRLVLTRHRKQPT